MFRFSEPIYLYLLVLIPILGIIRFVMRRRQMHKLLKCVDKDLLKELAPDVSKWRSAAKFWLLAFSFAFLAFVLARPQMGTKISNEKRSGIETVIAVDVSNSMLAEDVAPSRLDRSKMMVENMVEKFTDDKVGLIVFAGESFVQLPITSDYVSAKMFLSSISPSMITTQGTDIAQAIKMAVGCFTPQEGVGKAIIVITDGEDHEGGAVEAATDARKRGMRVFILGVGSTSGSPIPVPGSNDYMTDNAGNTVMSALNEAMCKEIASAGGGAYIHVDNNSNAQEQLDNELDKLAKKEFASNIYSDYDEQFQAFAIIALLLLIIEVCVLERKNPLIKRINIFGGKSRKVATLLVVAASIASAGAQERRDIKEGNKKFRQGNFADSEVYYRKALEKNAKNPQALYNLGNALFAQKSDSAAVRNFEKAISAEKNPLRQAMAYHNIGVVCQSHKMYQEAIEAYKNALRRNPADDEARYNMELCKRQQKKQQDKKQQQQDKNKQDGKDKNSKDKQSKDKQKQQKPQDKNKMSKENAEQLLNAAIQQEKNTQQRMKKAQQTPQSRKLQKNW